MMTEAFEIKNCEKHGEYEAKALRTMGKVFYNHCPKCVQELKELKQQKEENMKAAAIKAAIDHARNTSNIPKRFQKCSFDNFRTENDGQERALKVAQAYVDDWTQANEDGRCLIFSGKAGTGKTHLACAIANKLIDKGERAKFFTVTSMLRKIKESFSKDSTDTESGLIDDFANVQFLILDEAGMDYGTEFNKTLLFEVLNCRYENMKPTIVMTNLDIGALKEYFGERILDRMREGGGKLVSFNWESQRK